MSGWLTPNNIPEDDECRPLFIPHSAEWLAIVSGAILELTRSWNWEQFGELTPDECAERMLIMQQQFYDGLCNDCELPEGGRIIRINFDGRFQEMVSDEWVEPQGDYVLPPVPTRSGGTDQELRCLAAANAANVLSELYEQVTDQFNEHISAAEALTHLAILLGLLIAPPLGLLGASVLAIGRVMFGEFYAFMDFLTEDVWSEDFDNALKCILYECSTIEDGVVTFDYTCVSLKLGDNTNPFDLSLTEFRLMGQVLYLLNVISIDGLNLAGATTAIEEADCGDCEQGWCQNFDFTTTPDLSEWDVWTKGTWGGEYWQGVNSTAGSSGGNFNNSVGVRWDFDAPVNITRIQVNVTLATGSSGVGCDTTIYKNPASSEVLQSFIGNCGTNEVHQWSGDEDMDGVGFWVNGGRSTSPGTGSAGAIARIHAIRIWGTGENPFGVSNCI